jgi:hypothetical protein
VSDGTLVGWWEENRRKTCTSATLFTTNPTRTAWDRGRAFTVKGRRTKYCFLTRRSTRSGNLVLLIAMFMWRRMVGWLWRVNWNSVVAPCYILPVQTYNCSQGQRKRQKAVGVVVSGRVTFRRNSKSANHQPALRIKPRTSTIKILARYRDANLHGELTAQNILINTDGPPAACNSNLGSCGLTHLESKFSCEFQQSGPN